MTNKEFYFDKLLAIALANACGTFHRVVHGENCGEKDCKDCEFYTVESIENWLNAEREEPEPPLLKNGDGLKPGDWIMVRNVDSQSFVRRQFLYFFDGKFVCSASNSTPLKGFREPWKQARLPMEGE